MWLQFFPFYLFFFFFFNQALLEILFRTFFFFLYKINSFSLSLFYIYIDLIFIYIYISLSIFIFIYLYIIYSFSFHLFLFIYIIIIIIISRIYLQSVRFSVGINCQEKRWVVVRRLENKALKRDNVILDVTRLEIVLNPPLLLRCYHTTPTIQSIQSIQSRIQPLRTIIDSGTRDLFVETHPPLCPRNRYRDTCARIDETMWQRE